MPYNTPMTTITSPPPSPPFLQKLFFIENINRWNDKQRGGCKRLDLFANWIKQYFVSDLQSYSFVSLYCQYYGHYRHYGLSTWLHSYSFQGRWNCAITWHHSRHVAAFTVFTLRNKASLRFSQNLSSSNYCNNYFSFNFSHHLLFHTGKTRV